MMTGAQMSRTINRQTLREWFDPKAKARAGRNYRKAATWVLEQHEALPLTPETLQQINALVLDGLWMGSPEGRALEHDDPVAFAYRVKATLESVDAGNFVDGNGRTSRLFADLILLKHGLAPAHAMSQEDYFRYGSGYGHFANGSVVSPSASQLDNFRQMVTRGQRILDLSPPTDR
jgi:Fic family protein